MNQYNVYGLGNALVDYEYQVTPEWLVKMGIEKGVMTLMNKEQQAKIIAAIKSKAIKRASGGSGANSIIALVQMGGNAYYTCKVAADADGYFYAKNITDCGVASNLATHNASQGITGKCLVLVTDDADRTMCTFLGITNELTKDMINLDALKNSEYLYLEGYLVTSDSALQAAITAREVANQSGVKTAISLSDPNIVKFFKKDLRSIIGKGVNLLFANENEAMRITGTATIVKAAEELKKIAKTFVITRGAEGSLVFDSKTIIKIAPFVTTAIDTLGAGDMFAGAFLYALTQGKSYEDTGKLASLASSRIVAKFGPRFATKETQMILKEFNT